MMEISQKWSLQFSKTFTFTFICLPGKTHNHRSRGDTPWKAQIQFSKTPNLNHGQDTVLENASSKWS